MWVSKKRWRALELRLAAIEAQQVVATDQISNASRVGMILSEYGVVPFREKAKYHTVPIGHAIKLLAEKVGVKFAVEPAKDAVPAKVVLRKIRS